MEESSWIIYQRATVSIAMLTRGYIPWKVNDIFPLSFNPIPTGKSPSIQLQFHSKSHEVYYNLMESPHQYGGFLFNGGYP